MKKKIIKILAFPKNRFSGNPHISNFYKEIEGDNRFIIKDLNTINAILEKFDIFHLHWPEFFIKQSHIKSFFRIIFFIFILYIFKLRKTKIIWTVHNLYPHNNIKPKLYLFVLNILKLYLDGITFFSYDSRTIVNKQFKFTKSIKNAVIPHALYDYNLKPSKKITEDLLKNINIKERGSKLLLFFGRIDKYKDLKGLIKTFNKIDDKKLYLLIVGNYSEKNYFNEIKKLSDKNKNLTLIIGFFPEEKISSLFHIADLVVLPFINILNSGSLMLALSLQKPVLAPSLGSINELKDKIGHQTLITYDKLNKEILMDAVSKCKAPKNDILQQFSLKNVAKLYQNFYLKILNSTMR